MLRIALISPKGPLYRHRGGIFGQTLRYTPLTLTTLAALIPDDLAVDVKIYDEGVQDVPRDLDIDLVGLTVITGNARRAYELAARYRKQGLTVVLGGPHVTLAPDDASPHADSIVTGYAEESWPQLLRDFKAGTLQPFYRQRPDMDLAGLPHPLRELLPRTKYITHNVVEATRGCVHNCDFCVVPAAWGRRPLQRPVGEVVAEIESLKPRHVLFVDLNLTADPGYAARLFEALLPLGIHWYGLATTLLVRNAELLDLASRSGCRGLLMGLESMSPDSLCDADKCFNSPEDYYELVNILHAHKIALQGCFVFGLDHDRPDVFKRTAEFVVAAGVDLPRFAVVTPFPGTELYRRLDAEGRILSRNWDLYDGQHVVFEPAKMSVSELEQGLVAAWRHAYSATSMWKRMRKGAAPLMVNLLSNLGYRFYSRRLDRYYTCDWPVLGLSQLAGRPRLMRQTS
jgi:radical SAM superfamily enzyme YgiQ (UPF0313 family)